MEKFIHLSAMIFPRIGLLYLSRFPLCTRVIIAYFSMELSLPIYSHLLQLVSYVTHFSWSHHCISTTQCSPNITYSFTVPGPIVKTCIWNQMVNLWSSKRVMETPKKSGVIDFTHQSYTQAGMKADWTSPMELMFISFFEVMLRYTTSRFWKRY